MTASAQSADRPAAKRAIWFGVALATAALIIFALAKAGYLPGRAEAEAWLSGLSGSPWGLPAVIVIFCVGAFLGVPQFALIAASVAVFGPLLGGPYAWVANMISGALTFWIGRAGGEAALRRHGGPQLQKLSRLIGQNALAASAIVRNVPAGPFLIVNMAFGASAARFRDYWAGMALGILPKITLIAVGWQTLRSAWDGNPWIAGALATLAALLYLGLVVFVIRRARRAWQNVATTNPTTVDTGK